MGRIAVLPPEVSQRIAAGEVIERPASVVKEACENALDAGARRIEVGLRAGGIEEIAVRDDGCGMDPDDALLAFQRHATSKLRRFEDLERLDTLGFRGEALPSIAAVGRVELVTRPAARPEATRVSLEEGTDARCASCAAAPGTQLTVRDLFGHMPARRAALGAPGHELTRCVEAVTAQALARPDVAFRVLHEGREILQTPGDGELLSACVALWGPDVARGLLAVSGRGDGWEVEGYAGAPPVARGSRAAQFLSIDGRPVRAEAVRGAVEQAYAHLLQVRRYPLFVLRLRGTPGEYDANVHPSKREVRLYHPERVRRVCHHAVRVALTRADLVAEPALAAALQTPADPLPPPPRTADAPTARGAPAAAREELPAWVDRPAPDPDVPRLPALRALGQFGDAYLVALGPDGVYLIDQHAAHERVFFEALQRPGGPRQPLLEPVLVRLSADERRRWEELGPELARLGLEAEPFGAGALLIRSVPAGLDSDPAAALADVLARPEAGADALTSARRALAACKAAIKAGTPLAHEDQTALLAELARCREPFTCPHGRPTVLRWTRSELERYFGRR
jgi:DNA mismatch repair protein MutL